MAKNMVNLLNGMTMAQSDLRQTLKMAKKKVMRFTGKKMAISNLKLCTKMVSQLNKSHILKNHISI